MHFVYLILAGLIGIILPTAALSESCYEKFRSSALISTKRVSPKIFVAWDKTNESFKGITSRDKYDKMWDECTYVGDYKEDENNYQAKFNCGGRLFRADHNGHHFHFIWDKKGIQWGIKGNFVTYGTQIHTPCTHYKDNIYVDRTNTIYEAKVMATGTDLVIRVQDATINTLTRPEF